MADGHDGSVGRFGGATMLRETQEVLAREINVFLAEHTTSLADSIMRNPVSEYTDPARLASEKALLFRKLPIVVGHSSALGEPKDFIAEDIGDVPVLVVRQSDGSLKAFLNVCRHRGSKVTFEACGNRGSFSCPYHAWTYRPDGSLANLTNADDFGDVDRGALGLVELPVEERHGLIWVVLQPGSSIDVAAHLGPVFDPEMAAYGIDTFVVERSFTTRARANWKVIVDGFLETYHLGYLHRTTIGPHIRSNLAPFRTLGPHGCMTAVRTSFDRIRGEAVETADIAPHLVNAYQLFPNSVIVWSGRHFEVWIVHPDGDDPNRSIVKVLVLGRASEVPDPVNDYWGRNWVVVTDTVLTEDMSVGEAIQQGFATGAQSHVTFGRNEPGVQHFHAMVRSGIGIG